MTIQTKAIAFSLCLATSQLHMFQSGSRSLGLIPALGGLNGHPRFYFSNISGSSPHAKNGILFRDLGHHKSKTGLIARLLPISGMIPGTFLQVRVSFGKKL